MKKIIVLSVIVTLCWCIVVPDMAMAAPAPLKPVLTEEKPIFVDVKEKSISLLARVNGKYFSQPTRHGIVFAGGSNGGKAVSRGLATHEDFYDGLMKLGFKPGNNMTKENAAKTFVQGDLLEVTITWDGAKKEYSLDEVITDSNKKPFQIRFGGNLEKARQYKTGCLLCLDSCPVGITSNANYTMGAVEMRNEVVFKGNSKVLPPDGSFVVIKVKAKK